MKKLTFLATITFFFVFSLAKDVDAATFCNITANPSSLTAGDSATITITGLNSGETYQIIGYHNAFAWVNEPSYVAGGSPLSFPLDKAADGHYDVRVNSGATEVCFLGIDVKPKAVPAVPGGPLGSPKSWLPNLDPGAGLPKAQLPGFLETEVFPFLIKGSLFLMFSLSIIFLIVGAIMYITSGGNKEGMAKAKNTITYALIGLALGVGSAIILSVIASFLGAEIL